MTESAPPTAIIVGRSPVRLWGLTGAERLTRSLARAGVHDVHHRPDGDLAGLDLSERVLLLRADWAFDNAVVASLAQTPNVGVRAPDADVPAALHVSGEQAAEAARILLEERGVEGSSLRDVPIKTPEELCGSYNDKLRKREAPYLLRVTPETRAAVEKRIFAGSYKGVTDIVTKYIFPLPSRIVTGWAARLRLKPNHITFVGLLATLATIALWWKGEFGWGLLTAWLMCLLDTVDGKLARVTLTSSKLGDIFDHAIDLIHPPFWYWAWIVGLGPEFAARPEAPWVLWTIVVVYIAQRLEEAYFIKVFGIELHIWRPFDSFFRSITARRDPNLLVLTIAWALGQEALGITFIAAWAALSFLIHLVRIVQAHIARAKGQPIVSHLGG